MVPHPEQLAKVAVVGVWGRLSVDSLMSAPVSELSVTTLLSTDPSRKSPLPSVKFLMSALVIALSMTSAPETPAPSLRSKVLIDPSLMSELVRSWLATSTDLTCHR